MKHWKHCCIHVGLSGSTANWIRSSNHATHHLLTEPKDNYRTSVSTLYVTKRVRFEGEAALKELYSTPKWYDSRKKVSKGCRTSTLLRLGFTEFSCHSTIQIAMYHIPNP